MWWTILAAAYADTLELDNGAVLLGELAAYDRAGACHIAVGEGSLAGAIVVVPCARVVRMERERTAFVEAPAPEPVSAPVVEPEPVFEEDGAVAEPPPVVEVPLALPAEEALPPAPIAPPAADPTAVAAQEAPAPAEPLHRTWLDNLQFSDPFRR